MNNLAEDLIARGRMAEGEAIYDRIAERLERAGYVQGLAWMYSAYAELLYEVGDWERASSFVASFERVLGQLLGHYLEFEVRFVQARIAHARGDLEGAERLWTRAVALGRDMGDPQAIGPVLAGTALLLLDLGRREEAAALTDEVLRLQDDQGRALSYRFVPFLGWLVHGLGRADEFPRPGRGKLWYEAGALLARGELVEAADVFGAHGMRTEEAYARLRAAEALAAEGRRAEAELQLERSLGFYRSVGATTYVRRGEALLRASA
jgi:tetratricopeptide (TPR) repeat protein